MDEQSKTVAANAEVHSTGDVGNLRGWAEDEAQLLARAQKYRTEDPFPNIPPALLATAEIRDYDRVTGMLGELVPIPTKHLKAASVELFVGGEYVYWQGKKKINKRVSEKDLYITLPANSIVFVQTKNFFRLPDYIAMRFNLRITHVHRGLLLGTGPLVDPGYRGRLLIPLHNLTSSDYRLDVKDALIWAEFTKTSAHFETIVQPVKEPEFFDRQSREVAPFDGRKLDKSPDEYLFKAGNGYPIASSIPSAVQGARKDAAKAKKTTEGVQAWARGFGLLAVLGAVVGITGIVNTTWNLVQTAGNTVSSVKADLAKLEGTVTAQTEAAKRLETENEQGRTSVTELRRRLDVAERARDDERSRIESLQDRLTRLESQPGPPVRAKPARSRPGPSAPARVVPTGRPR